MAVQWPQNVSTIVYFLVFCDYWPYSGIFENYWYAMRPYLPKLPGLVQKHLSYFCFCLCFYCYQGSFLFGCLKTFLSRERPVKTLTRLRGCVSWSKTSLGGGGGAHIVMYGHSCMGWGEGGGSTKAATDLVNCVRRMSAHEQTVSSEYTDSDGPDQPTSQ